VFFDYGVDFSFFLQILLFPFLLCHMLRQNPQQLPPNSRHRARLIQLNIVDDDSVVAFDAFSHCLLGRIEEFLQGLVEVPGCSFVVSDEVQVAVFVKLGLLIVLKVVGIIILLLYVVLLV